jgi:hypothetical protein
MSVYMLLFEHSFLLIIQFNSCFFTCKLNSTEVNYKVSTSTQKYTKIIKEQNTKYDSLYNSNKLMLMEIRYLTRYSDGLYGGRPGFNSWQK